MQDAQKGLDKLGTTAKQATETAARGMDTAADSARDPVNAAHAVLTDCWACWARSGLPWAVWLPSRAP